MTGAAPAVSAAGGAVQVMMTEAATWPVTGWDNWPTAGAVGQVVGRVVLRDGPDSGHGPEGQQGRSG
jgi:hypothetical protein